MRALVEGVQRLQLRRTDTPGDATLGTPWNVDITGDRAYFVAPLTYTYVQHGKTVKESASFAVALKRTSSGWRITAWAYSKQQLL